MQSKFGNKGREGAKMQWLCEDVGNLLGGWDRHEVDGMVLYFVANDVAIHFDMFGAFVEDGIVRDMNGGVVVTEYVNRFCVMNAKVFEER